MNTNGHQGVLDVTQWTQKKLWSQRQKCPNRRSGVLLRPLPAGPTLDGRHDTGPLSRTH